MACRGWHESYTLEQQGLTCVCVCTGTHKKHIFFSKSWLAYAKMA